MKQTFLEGKASTLRFYPPEEIVADSATVALFYSSKAELEASSAATVDSVSTTLAAAAAKNARSITITDETGIVKGVRYLVQEAGRTWICEVESVAGAVVYTSMPVPFALTTAATFKGYALSTSLTTTHTADIGDNYRAQWVYELDSVEYQSEQLFDVVAAKDYCPTTLFDVTARYDWIRQHISKHDIDGSKTLRETWQKALKPLLRQRELKLERVRDLEALIPLHVAIVNKHFAENLAMIDSDFIQQLNIAREIVETELQHLTADLDWYDENQDLAAGDGEQHVRRTFVFMGR
jgi:hypothetical protein